MQVVTKCNKSDGTGRKMGPWVGTRLKMSNKTASKTAL